MRRTDTDITDLEEFDDVSDFYFDEADSRDFFDREEDQDDDTYSFRSISEL